MQTNLILILVIVFLAVVIFFMGRVIWQKNKENKSLQKANENQKKNLSLLISHIEKLEKIKKSNADQKEEVEYAETEADINMVIAQLVANNNNRV